MGFLSYFLIVPGMVLLIAPNLFSRKRGYDESESNADKKSTSYLFLRIIGVILIVLAFFMLNYMTNTWVEFDATQMR